MGKRPRAPPAGAAAIRRLPATTTVPVVRRAASLAPPPLLLLLLLLLLLVVSPAAAFVSLTRAPGWPSPASCGLWGPLPLSSPSTSSSIGRRGRRLAMKKEEGASKKPIKRVCATNKCVFPPLS